MPWSYRAFVFRHKTHNQIRMKNYIGVHTPLKSRIIIHEAHILVLPSIRCPQIIFYKQLDEKGHWSAHSFETPNNRPRGTHIGLTEHPSSAIKHIIKLG